MRQARYAHTVYAPEVCHPVEVTAAEQTHLVHWLSKRLGRTLKVPNLSAQGYELVGGRLLPGDTGARAQFMFQNGAGTRLTLYLGAMQAPAQSEVTKRKQRSGLRPTARCRAFTGWSRASAMPCQDRCSAMP